MPKKSTDSKFLESLRRLNLGEEVFNQIKETTITTGQQLIIVKGSINRGMNVSLPQIIKQIVKKNSIAESEKVKG